MKKNIVIAFLVLIILGFAGYFAWQKNLNQVVLPMQNTVSQSTDSVPEKNAVYLGEYEGKTTLFSIDSVSVFDNGPYEGNALLMGRVDFRTIANPKKVYTFSSDSEGPSSFLLSENRDKLYVTFNHHVYDNFSKAYTEIVEIDLTKNSNRVIWTSNGLTTDPNGPAFLLKNYNDTYLSFVRAGCFACGGGDGTLFFLNLTTNKYVQADSGTGNIEIDISAGTFSYQKLVTVCSLNNTPCEDPYPETKPHGPVITKKLP